MDQTEKILISLMVFAVLVFAGFVAVLDDSRIHDLQNRVHELECRHVMFEDGSTLHKDAELTQVCLTRK